MNREFTSYAGQDLSSKKIIKYAQQYTGVDMSCLIGADEDNFPFLVVESESETICFWNAYNGIMDLLMEDQVQEYALKEFLRENAYPVFDSIESAEKHAIDRAWPRKKRE